MKRGAAAGGGRGDQRRRRRLGNLTLALIPCYKMSLYIIRANKPAHIHVGKYAKKPLYNMVTTHSTAPCSNSDDPMLPRIDKVSYLFVYAILLFVMFFACPAVCATSKVNEF